MLTANALKCPLAYTKKLNYGFFFHLAMLSLAPAVKLYFG